jgi:hypothetical protein
MDISFFDDERLSSKLAVVNPRLLEESLVLQSIHHPRHVDFSLFGGFIRLLFLLLCFETRGKCRIGKPGSVDIGASSSELN